MPRRQHQVTAKTKARFLRVLADCGNVRVAAQAIGFSPETVYTHRRRDPRFAKDWDTAMETAMMWCWNPKPSAGRSKGSSGRSISTRADTAVRFYASSHVRGMQA
jgi:hypothetical protein